MTNIPTLNGDFDPTAAVHMEAFHNAMVGTAPPGFKKIRLEICSPDLLKLIGYDPRGIQPIKMGGKLIQGSRHVSQSLVELQKEVQRSIDADKVAEMVAYLHAAISSAKYADWSELDVVTTAQPDTSRFATEHVVLLPTAAEYFIIDGQHRFCALMDFARTYPDLAKKFTQALAISILDEQTIREWAGQGFHDKNYLRTVVTATKALLVDHRDPHNILAKKLHEHPLILDGGGVNEEKGSLPAGSKEMVTHSMLYKFVRGFCEGRRGLHKGRVFKPRLTSDPFEEHQCRLDQYVRDLGQALPTWTDPNKRAEYLFRCSPAWQALGVIGCRLRVIDDEDERQQLIYKLGEAQLDWRRTNLTWESIIGAKQHDSAGNEWISPRASTQATDNSISFLKKRLGLDAAPEPEEEEEIEKLTNWGIV